MTELNQRAALGSSVYGARAPLSTIPRQFTAFALAAAMYAFVPDGHAGSTSTEGPAETTRAPARPVPAYLASLWGEMCSFATLSPGWDGTDSVSPSTLAVAGALDFLLLLPATIRPPAATVASDGVVGWYWKGKGHYVGVNFLPGGMLAYYGRAPGMQARGMLQFDRAKLPQDLIEILRAI